MCSRVFRASGFTRTCYIRGAHVGTAALGCPAERSSAIRPGASSRDRRRRHWRNPEPLIFVRIEHETSTHRIIQNILHFFIQLLRASQYSIERLFLPHPATTHEQTIDQMSRSSFNCIHDFGQGINFSSLFIDQRSKDQMNMIGHDHDRVNVHFSSMIVQATSQCNCACFFRENPALVSTKGHKMWLVVALQMRQSPPVKRRGHSKFSRRDSRPRLSAERSSALFHLRRFTAQWHPATRV